MGRVAFLAGVVALLIATVGCHPPAETGRLWRTFVAELTNVDLICSLDLPGTRLLSSFDRRGGNDDFNYFFCQSSEPGWVVIADLKGPGCIRRFWLTGIDLGHPLKMYFDGERRPRLSGPVQELFGDRYPFTAPLVMEQNTCWWSYLPLTFNKSLRIETKTPPINPRWGPRKLFFQLNVEDLPASQAVQTFPRRLTSEDQAVLARVSQVWSNAAHWPDVSSLTTLPAVHIPPGATGLLFEAAGPSTLTGWSLRVEPETPTQWTQRDRGHLPQDAMLRVTYDRLPFAGIASPIGDFFCNGDRERAFGSLLLGANTNGYRCELPMPFQQHVQFELINGADQPILARLHLDPQRPWNPNDGYLHATWRRSGPENGKPHILADFQGRGKYVGCYLSAASLDKSWWILEGDDIFYVDGEPTPSWHGTGLEDYFNGGWYYRCATLAPLHGLLGLAPFHSAQYRFHLVDPLCFSKSIHLEWEQGDQNVSHGYMRSVAYAYLKAPSAVLPCPIDRAARRVAADPMRRQNIMYQLNDLERLNNFQAASDFIAEYVEQDPGAEENGVLQLRQLEYQRLLNPSLSPTNYQPFLEGGFGRAAQEQAKLLEWFYTQPNRALISMNVNGLGQVILDGREVLRGDDPYHWLVTGIEIQDGPHALAVAAQATREWPWLQLGVRMSNGIHGTGPDTLATLNPGSNWQTAPPVASDWKPIGRDLVKGPPNYPYVGGIPNAFILLSSKAYGVASDEWINKGGTACFRMDFTAPIQGWPAFAHRITGLDR